MNFFDFVLLIILASSVLAGLRSGFARVVIGLAATVIGLLAGFWCYRIVGANIAPWVNTPALADILGFMLIFFGVMLAGALFATLLARLFRWVGLSWFDHLLGAAAGFVRGILMIAAMAAVLVAFVPSPTPAFLKESRLLPYATQAAAALAQMAPRDLKDTFLQQWENLKEFWNHRQQPSAKAV